MTRKRHTIRAAACVPCLKIYPILKPLGACACLSELRAAVAAATTAWGHLSREGYWVVPQARRIVPMPFFFGLSAYRRIPDLQAWNGNSLPPIPLQTPDHKQDEKSGWSRLKQVIDWSGMSVNRFAGAVGLQRSESLYQIKKGKNGISRRLASRILEHYPQINFTWLMTGKGHMLAEEKTDLFKIPITLRLTSEEAHDLLDLLKKMLEKPAPPDDRPL